MTNASKTLLLALAILLQTTLLGRISVFGTSLNIVFPLMLSMAVSAEITSAIYLGFLCGLAIDALTAGIFGIHSLIYMYFAVAVCFISSTLYDKGMFLRSLLSALVIFISEFLLGVWTSLIAQESILWAQCLNISLRTALVGAVLFAAFSALLARMKPFRLTRGIRIER
ncbi:MAG: hypothetical protein Q4C12_04720 [Clostridia bacterium]|nr:hypothetical protein [Clostridia bacterium]